MPLLLYASLISVVPIYLIQHETSLLCSSHPDMLWYILSTLLSLIRSTLFDTLCLIQSNLFALIWSTNILSLWSDLIQSNAIQSNIMLSLIFYPLTLLCYKNLYFDHSNTVQYSCLVLPDFISILHSLELLILLKTTYH